MVQKVAQIVTIFPTFTISPAHSYRSSPIARKTVQSGNTAYTVSPHILHPEPHVYWV